MPHWAIWGEQGFFCLALLRQNHIAFLKASKGKMTSDSTVRFVQKQIFGPHAWSEQTRTPRHGSQEYAFGTNPLSGLYSHARLRTLPYQVAELGSDSGSEASDSFRRGLSLQQHCCRGLTPGVVLTCPRHGREQRNNPDANKASSMLTASSRALDLLGCKLRTSPARPHLAVGASQKRRPSWRAMCGGPGTG